MIANKENKGIWDDLERDPGLVTNPYQKVDYLGDFNPQQYATPEAAQYQTISEDPRVRDYQMQALARMQKFGDQAADSAESLGRYQAVSDANAVAAQNNAAIRNQMAMRGQGGAGLEFVLGQQAGQNAANRAQGGALQAAQQAALQRLMGTQAAMQGASGIRGQDANVAAQNAAIINAFNMANTQARNQTNQANVDMKNSAGLRNTNTRQGIAGTNTNIANQSQDQQNVNRMNTLQAQRDWARGRMGLNNEHTQYMQQAFTGVGAAGDTAANMMAGGMGSGGGMEDMFGGKKK